MGVFHVFKIVQMVANHATHQTSLNEEISYIGKTMQLNGYPLNVTNKTIKNTLQINSSENKNEKLESLKMFIPYEKGVAEKLKHGIARLLT